MSENTSGLLLSGLDGANPLAFLAALGTLRMLTIALPGEKVRMSWEQSDGAWRPKVWCSLSGDGDAIVQKLEETLAAAAARQSFAIGDNLNLPAGEFRSHLLGSIRRPEEMNTSEARIDCDFYAAFGSEVVTDDKGLIADTALRTMSGAGHQHFLKFFRELVRNTDAGHLRRTLFFPWDYADEGRGMNLRWDPADDRRYALRWDDPSGDPSRCMRGANRLAIEALPFLPTQPTIQGLATTAFSGRGARDTYFTWPIWNVPLSMDVTRSVLARAGSNRNDPVQLAAQGIQIRYKSARITTGKFRNFTPGVPA